MITAAKLQADLTTHHIEGRAIQGNTPFSCPLISRVNNKLWQGGCVNGVSLEGYFSHIVSLYPWEVYDPGGPLKSCLSVRLNDELDIPNEEQLYAVARWINICRKRGRTLVHCQAGLNRSALVTGLALVLSGQKAEDVIKQLRECRSPAVLCNKAFEMWLLAQTP